MDVRSLARAYTPMVVKILGGIASNGESENARVAACSQLLDRGWGKSASVVEHTGKDGAEDIQVTIRTILGQREK